MRFTKMHGIGNDYVYVDAVSDPAIGQRRDLPEIARSIADRHTGVGGDGLILILPPRDGTDAHVRMRMFNADGSESEMCGNGVRCVAKYAHDHRLSRANPMRVETGRGVLSIECALNGEGTVEAATVDMGEPILSAHEIPVSLPAVNRVVKHPTSGLITWPAAGEDDWIDASGLELTITCVSMGNPHAVFYCKDVSCVPLEVAGPAVERHPMFPRRANVHFVQVRSPGDVTMRTWERGSGVTRACGTGACAVCVAGVLGERTKRDLLVHLPGGDLGVRWCEQTQHVFMTGNAIEVFTGQWPHV